jgi:hypothetical protein
MAAIAPQCPKADIRANGTFKPDNNSDPILSFMTRIQNSLYTGHHNQISKG